MPTYTLTLDLDGTALSQNVYKWIDLDVPFCHEIQHESNSLWEIVSIAMGYFRALYGDTKYAGTEEQGLIACLSRGFSDNGWCYPSTRNIGGCLPEDADIGFSGTWSIIIEE